MSIQKSFAIISATNIALALLVLGALFFVSHAQRAETESVKRRFDSYLLGDELRQSSDDLTRLARTYVVTGEDRYREIYQRILDIRDGTVARPEGYERVYWDYIAVDDELPPAFAGEQSLIDRMHEVGISEEEFELLQSAKDASDALATIEIAAMDAVADQDFGSKETLHDAAYHLAKTAIMTPIDRFLHAIDRRTKAEVGAARSRESSVTKLAACLAFATVLLAMSSMWLLRRRMVDPLAELAAQARQVGEGNYTKCAVSSAKNEIGDLGATFNAMVTDLAERTDQLELERQRAESLLLNILPKPVAERLKVDRGVIADSYQEVTVLFADIVGFTEMSATIDSSALVRILDRVFSSFDEIAATHGLEKIKTIGDCYMAACGLPERQDDHVTPIVEFALAILEKLEEISEKSGLNLRVRVGVNTGPVTAGVIGQQKFIYDLWGDAVNTASRMESHGEAGRIQVTEAVYQALRDRYEFEARGLIEIKGKGAMKTYFLTGRRPVPTAG